MKMQPVRIFMSNASATCYFDGTLHDSMKLWRAFLAHI